jgi:hypothetical protein
LLSGDSKQIVEQGNKRQADDGDTSARHELYHGELAVKGFHTKIYSFAKNKKVCNPSLDRRQHQLSII